MSEIIEGDCLGTLPTLSPRRFHCCVTSPPYYGLRDYKVGGRDWPAVTYQPMPGLPEMTVLEWTGCLGMEPTPEMFVAHIVLIFREVWRVLRDDGTLWLNFGDSYAGGGTIGRNDTTPEALARRAEKYGTGQKSGSFVGAHGTRPKVKSLKSKDLMGIPWRVAFALQADGWYLRQDVIWHKPNSMPESVKDRCTKAHEYIFLLSKSDRYYYDAEAVKEDASNYLDNKAGRKPGYADGTKGHRSTSGPNFRSSAADRQPMDGKRNRRSVWTVATKPCSEAHFAVYPAELIEPCILAGSPVEGHVLDPFGGAGTTAMVCKRHRRNYTLIELSVDHCEIARRRIEQEPHPQITIFDALTG